ncbi:hypothetical protein SAMN04487943_12114 [Gracilibacillus orientalis]|uniref:Uncharacterized protein n=1 Tax=Gracilibacillus orientalis TaxID=334253 RepID=A0A1I4R6B0_9BACI|nr:hypothetical protein [Gracilibacillus orientalis]SFM47791.1 hypothetical protein SAMN04487943_12114 [Gracilibacillus orientalis]
MYKIKKISMVDNGEVIYDYKFDYGINYFKGKNSSGKTEFYNFIDFMFGDSQNIKNKVWYRDSLNYAIIEFEYNKITYLFKRTLEKDINYFKYKGEEWGEPISLAEYKDKLHSIFTIDHTTLNRIRDFTEENLTYRTFTIFNFLGEKSFGNITDFFTKSKNIKYSTKLPALLNYVFNNNLEKIFELKKNLHELQQDVNLLKRSIQRFDFVKNNINVNLKKLNIPMIYNGKNNKEIFNEIYKVKSLEESKKSYKKPKTISELESIHNNLNEQIKIYENTIEDNKNFEIENLNRKKLVDNLSSLISDKSEYKYLAEPIITMADDLDKRISFNKYVITNHSINDLKKQRKEIKEEIFANESRFSSFNISEKSRSIALVEEYLSIDVSYDAIELETKQKQIKKLKEEIKILQNNDDNEKINHLSDFITELYKSAINVSDIVRNDEDLEGFYIQYHKKGNILQPKIVSSKSNKIENYYVGSMARHTLMQFCGYLGFLRMLIKENKYPLVPILVIDHISKPFDIDNRRAIGEILKKFYQYMDEKDLQIFIFDEKDYKDLFVTPNHSENLVDETKTGFNPFFNEVSNTKDS